jgi:hypothetical protein
MNLKFMTRYQLSSLNRSHKRSVICSETAPAMLWKKNILYIFASNEYLFSDRYKVGLRALPDRLIGPVFLFYPGYTRCFLISLSVKTTKHRH